MAVVSEQSPWRGMHTADFLAQPGHCEVAINAEYSQGSMRVRPPARRVIAASGSETPGGFYCYSHADGTKYFLVIGIVAGTPSSSGSVRLHVYSHSGASFNTQDLLVAGQPATKDRFSFAEMGDRVYFSNGVGPIWRWSPYTGMDAERVVLSNGVFAALNKYLLNTPQTSHLCNHRALMVYSGLSHENWAMVSSDVPTLQNYIGRDVTGKKATQSASTLCYNDHHVLFSDMGTPHQICAASYISFYDGDPVVATASLGSLLFVFARRKIWVLDGLNVGADENWQGQLLSGTIGCAAPQSIIVVGDRVIFLSDDGFYAVSEEGGLEKLSGPLDRVFARTWEPTIPRPAISTVGVHGAPWYPEAAYIDRASAVYVPASGYYLCSLVTCSNGILENRTVFALHVPSGAWSVWCGSQRSFTPEQWGSFADEPDTGYFLNGEGAVMRLGPWRLRGYTDTTSAGVALAIPFLWVSQRHGETDGQTLQLEEIKFRIRGGGTAPTALRCMAAGEETQYDALTMTDSELQAQSPSMQYHPEPGEATGALYYWGAPGFRWGNVAAGGSNVPWTPAGRVTMRWTCNVVSRWLQYAILEMPGAGESNRLEVFGLRSKLEVLGDAP